MADLIVVDDNYESISGAYKEIGDYFEKIISVYTDELQFLCEYGVRSGTLHDNLESFREVANQLKGQIETIVDLASEICGDFITDIDDADKALY